MRKSPDVAVIGLGGMGAAITYELARRGAAVLGIDSHEPPHDRGSTHGRSRIIREAYFEHPLYVPLVQRAYELWSELEELTGVVIQRRTGGLNIGPRDGALVRGALASALTHDLEHELLDAEGIRRRFPGLLPDPEHAGVYEPRAGALAPEAAVRTFLHLARGHGADIRTGTRVTGWHAAASGDVVLETTGGSLHAPLVVFAAGPWLNSLLASDTTANTTPLQLQLAVERQYTLSFAPAPGVHAFRADQCPIALWEYDTGRFFYTFPDMGHGVKAGIHHEGDVTDPSAVDVVVSAAEEGRVRSMVDACMPGAAHRMLDAAVCLYTNTPDRHFLLDLHPGHRQVLLVSPCSGHGFKFAAAIGEAVAEWLLEGGSRFDLTPFNVARLLR
ncbi:N-methyl-L-tryptophan oxidase [soil metagenome]